MLQHATIYSNKCVRVRIMVEGILEHVGACDMNKPILVHLAMYFSAKISIVNDKPAKKKS